MSLSDKLKIIRAEKNLSQEQLAELLGVSRQAVSKWEQDNGYPETEKLVQIAQTLNVSLDYLLLDKKPAEHNTVTAKSNTGLVGEQKITIAVGDGGGKSSYAFYPRKGYSDNSTLSAYFKFKIMPYSGKNAPQCLIVGIDKSDMINGDHFITLGWYTTREEAEKELKGIYDAMHNGETNYHLKYNAKVMKGSFGKVKLASGND